MSLCFIAACGGCLVGIMRNSAACSFARGAAGASEIGVDSFVSSAVCYIPFQNKIILSYFIFLAITSYVIDHKKNIACCVTGKV